MDERPIVVVSNRGPIAFRTNEHGQRRAQRGAGGLVSGLTSLLRHPDRLWIAAAMSADDRVAIDEAPAEESGSVGTTTYRSIVLDDIHAIIAAFDWEDLRRSYEQICNGTLWFVHHHLFDLANAPVFDADWFLAWDAYRRINLATAELIAATAPLQAVVLVQDYHLTLVGAALAHRRPDVTTVHFSHTPFAEPHVFRVLPPRVRMELLEGLAGHHACGFHTRQWRDAFVAACQADGVEPPATFVAPLGPDADDLARVRSDPAFMDAYDELDQRVADRLVIARSDRIELSKNLIRGFLAFDELLSGHPSWRDRVCFAASVYPSREADPRYAAYQRSLLETIDEVNNRWSTPEWTPILVDLSDNFPGSMATLARADVVLVNPIRDGLNLVASEAMLINDRDALLALSPQAGAWELLGDAAQRVDPFDVSDTATGLRVLLETPDEERHRRAATLRSAAGSRSPADWLADQLAAAER